MAGRNAAFKSAVCKYKNLIDNEKMIMIAEKKEKAWKDRQAELSYAVVVFSVVL